MVVELVRAGLRVEGVVVMVALRLSRLFSPLVRSDRSGDSIHAGSLLVICVIRWVGCVETKCRSSGRAFRVVEWLTQSTIAGMVVPGGMTWR